MKHSAATISGVVELSIGMLVLHVDVSMNFSLVRLGFVRGVQIREVARLSWGHEMCL